MQNHNDIKARPDDMNHLILSAKSTGLISNHAQVILPRNGNSGLESQGIYGLGVSF